MTEKSLFSFALGLKNAGSLGGTFSFIEPVGTIIDKEWWQKVVGKKKESATLKEHPISKSDPFYEIQNLLMDHNEKYW